MKRKLFTFAMLAATTFFWMPTSGSTVSAFSGSESSSLGTPVTNGTVQQPGKHRNKWRKKNVIGYRNYGQYRRTQVGNRRYRLTKRYYWNNGHRLSRWVRVYY